MSDSYQKVIDSIFAAGGQPELFLISQAAWDKLLPEWKRTHNGRKEIKDPFRGWTEVVVSKPLDELKPPEKKDPPTHSRNHQ